MTFSLGLGCIEHLGNVAGFKHLAGLHRCTPGEMMDKTNG
jgi:hypothetical protein